MTPRMYLRTASAQSAVLLLAAGIPSTYSAVAANPKPPEPDPANPVNYIEWLNEAFGGDIEDNAYDAYLRAYEEFTPFDGDWADALDGPWSDQENRKLAKWLDANRKALQQFRRAAASEECFFLLSDSHRTGDARLDSWGMLTLQPSLSPHRNAARGLIASGYRSWQQTGAQPLAEDALLVLRSAHHFDGSVTILARLVGTSCARFAYKALRTGLHLSGDPDALAATILPQLSAADPPYPPLERAYLLERVSTWDTCQRVYKPGKRKGTWTIYGPALQALNRRGVRGVNAETLIQAGYDTTLAELNAYYDAVAEWSRSPYHLATDQADRINRMREGSHNSFVRALLPSVTRSRVLYERITAERRATHLITRLLAYHAEHDRFPRKLSQLDLPDVDELRIDPFSGRDFVYRRKGDSFTLYSVAENLKDDGGRHDEKWADGDFVFWPVQD